jgi:AGZA family xanthine/uracil permease-like MFS transporter
VAAGGRTGLTACTTGVLFLLSVFLSPLLSMITSSVTTPALVTVGVLMAQQLKQIDWDDWNVSAPCFLTILIMILGYSISDGVAAGFLFYTVSMAFSGKIKEIKPIVYVLDIIFLIYFIF